MKVLALMGSPRRDGNIAKMLDAAVLAAKGAGHTVQTVDLYALDLQYCTGCMACREKGLCILKDDIDQLRRQLFACDMVILAAPTYWANVPAAVKNMFDRLSGAVLDTSNDGIPKGRLSKSQKYLLLTACSAPALFDRLGGQSGGAFRAMKAFFQSSGMSCAGCVRFAGTKGKTSLPDTVISKIRGCVR